MPEHYKMATSGNTRTDAASSARTDKSPAHRDLRAALLTFYSLVTVGDRRGAEVLGPSIPTSIFDLSSDAIVPGSGWSGMF